MPNAKCQHGSKIQTVIFLAGQTDRRPVHLRRSMRNNKMCRLATVSFV